MPAQAVSEPRFTNRLIDETSPYLLQHAHNPVDWYPWGPEAFEMACRSQRPILVSVGYSTCYWCHVMERESFEDEETARLMNELFVCIKVDREERPDVDDVYMSAVQMLTGHGGWPMNVFLTPPPPSSVPAEERWVGLQPFWGGTYFPPESRYGRSSWRDVLTSIARAWEEQRDDVLQQADRIAAAIRERLGSRQRPVPVGAAQIGEAVRTLLQLFDREHGGFGQAPKFPQPAMLRLLMDARDSIGDEDHRRQVDEALSITLDRMAMGGMFDQVGGGFHRYSVDERWLVPHFEKMLYDNGQLAEAYALASEATGDGWWGEIAGRTCEYILREMTDPETGAFYSAQDAEVNHREGLNYLWTPEQVRAALKRAGEEELIEFAFEVYGLNEGTNFQDPHHPDDDPSNVLYLIAHPQRLADRFDTTSAQIGSRLRRINAALLTSRDERDQPGTDDKVIAGWNGLMIAGLAETGRVLKRPEFLEAAQRCWRFIRSSMVARASRPCTDGTPVSPGLQRTYRAGTAKIPAFCEDYAMLIHGLLALHRATQPEHGLPARANASGPHGLEADAPCSRSACLDDAVALMDEAARLFGDPDGGGYFDTRADQNDLFVRAKSTYDGAIASANGVMLNNLIELHRLVARASRPCTGETPVPPCFLDAAVATAAALSHDLKRNPLATVNAARGLLRLLGLAPQRLAEFGTEEIGVTDAVGPTAGDIANGAAPPPVDPVRLSIAPDLVTLGPGETATLTLTLDIAAGKHINAHDPGDRDLIGLSIDLIEPPGLVLEAEYPPGREWGPQSHGNATGVPFMLGDRPIRIHEGVVNVPLRLRMLDDTTPLPETARIVVACQPCTETECLAPIRREVTVRLADG